jgi:hypothetical protein
VAQEGIARLEIALPVLAVSHGSSEEVEQMGRVIVGVDPHKKSVTIEAIDEQGQVLATGRFATDSKGYRLTDTVTWTHRVLPRTGDPARQTELSRR